MWNIFRTKWESVAFDGEFEGSINPEHKLYTQNVALKYDNCSFHLSKLLTHINNIMYICKNVFDVLKQHIFLPHFISIRENDLS